MIFFLVNNSYQLYDAKLHSSVVQKNKERVDLIVIEHSISNPDYSIFDNVIEFPRFGFKNLFGSFFTSRWIRERVKFQIRPTEKDVLFLYTEHDPFNQLVAVLFKRNGAKVYLVEDGGFASYVPLCSEKSEKLNLKDRFKEMLLRSIPELRGSKVLKVNGVLFPQMEDKYLDGVCLYRKTSLHRNIASIHIRKPNLKAVRKIPGTVIFLNEKLYGVYQSQESYLHYLDLILNELSINFDVVYFKFHPRENEDQIRRISDAVLGKYSKIIVIPEKGAIEELIDRYRPTVAASYISAALLNLLDYGIEPLFVYPLVSDLVEQPTFKIMTNLLSSWGYIFPSCFSDMTPDFRSGLTDDDAGGRGLNLFDLALG